MSNKRFTVTRRAAIGGGLLGAGALAACAQTPPAPMPIPTGPFRHGVASGDPLADRVVIWTRVTLEEGGGDVEVSWELARDAGFSAIVRSGRGVAEASRDHTVKVDVDGLEPGQRYFYRFAAGGETSPVGRTRTLPVGPVASLTFAAVSCSNHAAGYFNSYRALAETGGEGLDLVLHLGDFLYEYGVGGYATELGAPLGRVPDPPHEIVTLADYRRRHAQYKLDPDLQTAHAVAPWITVWDDHEVTNDSWVGGAQNHDPSEGDWPTRRDAALRAYFEWMPIREPEPGRAREAIWRTFELGDLATLTMLETRLSGRDEPISLDDYPVPLDSDPDSAEVREQTRRWLADVVGDAERTMIGPAQEAHVAASFARSTAAGKPWQLLGNQVILGSVTAPNYMRSLPFWVRWYARSQGGQVWDYVRRTAFGLPMNLDAWDGYPAARERLYDAARRAGANILAVTGDTHNFFATLLAAADGARVGVEFGTTSISSPSQYDSAPPGVDFGRLTVEANAETVAYHNATARGFTLVTLTPERAETRMYEVTNVYRRRDFDVRLAAAFATAPQSGGGTTGLERLPI